MAASSSSDLLITTFRVDYGTEKLEFDANHLLNIESLFILSVAYLILNAVWYDGEIWHADT